MPDNSISNNRIVLTRDQFNTNIDNAISKVGVKGAKAEQFKNQASSIFTTNDTQGSNGGKGPDGKWNQAEADSASGQLAELYNIINSAAKGEMNDSEVNARLELQQFKTMSHGDQAKIINGEVDNFSNMSPEEQATDVVGDLKILKADGNEISINNGVISVNGKPINLDGVSDKAVEIILAEVTEMTQPEA